VRAPGHRSHTRSSAGHEPYAHSASNNTTDCQIITTPTDRTVNAITPQLTLLWPVAHTGSVSQPENTNSNT